MFVCDSVVVIISIFNLSSYNMMIKGYPYARNEYSKQDIINLYNQLKKNKIVLFEKRNSKDNNIKNYIGKYQTDKFNDNYFIININLAYASYKHRIILLTDYFQEDARIQCNDKLEGSMLDTYNSLKIQNVQITRKMLFDKVTKWCGVYPINIALTVYKIFKPKTILDMSSGWGDRLIAATMFNPELYVGIDPNKNLVQGYKQIIETFGNANFNKYKMICDAFEDVDLKDYKFDLMFSSPPFFIAEKYSTDEKQSFNRYKSIEQWLNNFMFVSLKKIWYHLNHGGHLVIDINDIKVEGQLEHFVDKINDYIDTFDTSEYLGVIKYKYFGQTHTNPIWVWKKI